MIAWKRLKINWKEAPVGPFINSHLLSNGWIWISFYAYRDMKSSRLVLISLKNGPNPASFCLFLFFSHDKFSTNFDYKWKNRRWCAWYLNTGQQDGRCRWIHWAMAATHVISHHFADIIINSTNFLTFDFDSRFDFFRNFLKIFLSYVFCLFSNLVGSSYLYYVRHFNGYLCEEKCQWLDLNSGPLISEATTL